MFIFSLILLQLVVFAGIGFFLKHLLTRNVTNATTHLQDLTEQYNKKQEEVEKKLSEIDEQYKETMRRANKDTETLKVTARKETEEEREKVLEDAHKQSDELMKRANESYNMIKKELEQHIDERAIELAKELVPKMLPDQVRISLHKMWVEALIVNGVSGIERLNVSEDIKQAEVHTPFPLNESDIKSLSKTLEEKLNRKLIINETIRPELVAGIVINIGNLVLDGSFLMKIGEVISESDTKKD